MIDYNNLGLNQFLQPNNSPVTVSNYTNGFEFDSTIERNAVSNSKVSNLSADKISAGTVTVSLGVGGANVTIDGANNRIIVNDGTVDRVLLGYQNGGF